MIKIPNTNDLVIDIAGIDISDIAGLVRKTDCNKKNWEIEKKNKFDTTDLITETNFSTNIAETENEII